MPDHRDSPEWWDAAIDVSRWRDWGTTDRKPHHGEVTHVLPNLTQILVVPKQGDDQLWESKRRAQWRAGNAEYIADDVPSIPNFLKVYPDIRSDRPKPQVSVRPGLLLTNPDSNPAEQGLKGFGRGVIVQIGHEVPNGRGPWLSAKRSQHTYHIFFWRLWTIDLSEHSEDVFETTFGAPQSLKRFAGLPAQNWHETAADGRQRRPVKVATAMIREAVGLEPTGWHDDAGGAGANAAYKRGDIVLIDFSGDGVRDRKPCVVVSPNYWNAWLQRGTSDGGRSIVVLQCGPTKKLVRALRAAGEHGDLEPIRDGVLELTDSTVSWDDDSQELVSGWLVVAWAVRSISRLPSTGHPRVTATGFRLSEFGMTRLNEMLEAYYG